MSKKTKLLGILNSIFGFFYSNWFVLPMVVCLYGIGTSEHVRRFILEINLILWLILGAILQQEMKKKDRQIEEQNLEIEKLFIIAKNSEKDEA